MDIWLELKTALYEPARHFVDPMERVYLFYLLSALVCAIVVHALLRWRQPGSTPRGVLGYLFPRAIYLHPSTIADYKFFLVDRVLSFVVVPFLVVSAGAVMPLIAGLLAGLFGPPEQPIIAPGGVSTLLYTLVNAAAIDFTLWAIHYLHHRVPVLWEFHKVHHSAQAMTPITAYRMHPVEIVISFNVTLAVGVFVLAVFQYLLAGTVNEYQVLGVNIVTYAFYVIGFNLRHSHVPMAYPRWLSHIFVSPFMHQLHHSKETRHLDKNMGFIFGFWDWAFGTLYVPKRGETFAIGLADGEDALFNGIGALYFRPFANLLRRYGVLAAERRA
jgi:sterol desaturase/sphingolipid hydroxylase (fatty acid hydroxylase superfamily)